MIVVVEPHADDAFLSLDGHIDRWNKMRIPVMIWTIASGTRKRAEDARTYAGLKRARWEGAGLKDTEITVDAVTDWLEEAILTIMDRHPPLFVVPLGIQNADHKAVRQAFEEADGLALQYYLDQPYASLCKNSTEVEAAAYGKRVNSWIRPRATKYRHIPVFKDQAKFFYYNPAEKLANNVEVVFK